MYCPNCKKEVTVPGNFCNACGTRLIETPKQNDISLKISDDAAVMGGINVNRNETHNSTNYDNRTINTSNITNNIVERQKTEAELHRERIQQFQGVVLQRSGSGSTETFTVRKISSGVGVERIFPITSPFIEQIDLNKQGVVRRARIFYLRGLTGKKARIKERRR